MQGEEIIKLWKNGLSKNKLAEIYKREDNQRIRIIRASVRHRHDGKFITNYQALKMIEKVIYEYITKNR